jgi:hypothetical protein
VCVRDPYVELSRRLTRDKSNLLRRPDRNCSDLNVGFQACFLCSGFVGKTIRIVVRFPAGGGVS